MKQTTQEKLKFFNCCFLNKCACNSVRDRDYLLHHNIPLQQWDNYLLFNKIRFNCECF